MRTGATVVIGVGVVAGLVLGVGALALGIWGEASKPTRPTVFTDLNFAEALAKAKADGKMLLVKYTAEWCGPCKVMDKTTFVDPGVAAWGTGKGLIVAVDVDQHKDLAAAARITAMPTMVVYKAGEEFDRVVGLRSAPELLAWLGSVEKGEKTADGIVKKLGGADGLEIHERLRLARELKESEKYDLATEEYVWLWKNMLAKEPSMMGVRVSFMANEIKSLAGKHAVTKTAFTNIRDETEARVKGEPWSSTLLSDWITLNSVLRDDERTVAWYDRVKDHPDSRGAVESMGHLLAPLLLQRNRYAEYGRSIGGPVQSVRLWHGFTKETQPEFVDADTRERLAESSFNMFRKQSGDLFGGLLAAGRDAEAADVAAEAIKLDDSAETRVALVNRALEMDQARASMTTLLDETKHPGASVRSARTNLDAKLKK